MMTGWWWWVAAGLCLAPGLPPVPALINTLGNKTVRLAVIVPEDPYHQQAPSQIQVMGLVLPVVELAKTRIERLNKLPGYRIEIVHRDSNCSSVLGPLAAIDLYKTTDAFLGPVCDYALAPVARYTGTWGVPVLTAGGLADNFSFKADEFQTLTRFMGSYKFVSQAMKDIITTFEWSHIGLLYYDHPISYKLGHSKYHFMLGPVFTMFGQNPFHRSFNHTAGPKEFKDLLNQASNNARVVVVCADPPTVREILLVADELNMVDSGEYVFFNIELFDSALTQRPWYVASDPPERNERAKKAYTALLTVTARTPDSPEYRQFSTEVKEKVKEMAKNFPTERNFTFGPDPVSTFVTAFYDAVLLYAEALNETLAMGENQTNGIAITHRMWNRTFKGITGDVYIDDNGDRITDYSLLDMDPESGEFRIVATYIGVNRSLVYEPNTAIHWAGGRTSPPPDIPACGFDNSLCDKDLPTIAVVCIVIGSVLTIAIIAVFFINRLFLNCIKFDSKEEYRQEELDPDVLQLI